MVVFLIGFVATVIAGLVLVRRAPAWGFIDLPQDRKVHVLPTPRTGGLAIAAGLLVVAGVWLSLGLTWPTIPWQTVVSGLGFFGMGGLDDRYGFPPKKKIAWFTLFALLAAWPWAFDGEGAALRAVVLGDWIISIPGAVAYPLLVFWFLAVPNAVNIEDAINGYMGGFTLILLGAAYFSGANTLPFMGILFGFLVLNWPKAKHFLGDAGSFGCGFLIAEVILRAGGFEKPGMALLLTAPISLDVSMGIIRRIRLGMRLFDADRSTFPHHTINWLGGSHTLGSLVLWTNAGVFVALTYLPGWMALVYSLVFMVVLVFANRRLLRLPFGEGAAAERQDPS